jgi:hypothetical protein
MQDDNFFAPNWVVYSREETRALKQWGGVTAALPPRSILGESIAMIWEDGISIIYWDGHSYRWAPPTHEVGKWIRGNYPSESISRQPTTSLGGSFPHW